MNSDLLIGLKAGMAGFVVLAIISIITFLVYVLNDYTGGPKIQLSDSGAIAVLSLIALIIYTGSGMLSSKLHHGQIVGQTHLVISGAVAGLIASVTGTIFDIIMRICARVVVVAMGLIPGQNLDMSLISSLVTGSISITWARGMGLAIAAVLLGIIGAWGYQVLFKKNYLINQ